MAKKITIIIEDDGTAQGLSFPHTGWDNDPWTHRRGYANPCEHCNNNPAVNPHASGICNCALPALANPIY